MEHDGVSQPFELVPCDHFISECTFGLPIYKFPTFPSIYADINSWWRANVEEGFNTVLYGYALGKAQNILAHLDQTIGEVYVHGAVANVNEALREVGYDFPGTRITADTDRSKMRGSVIIAPPSANGTAWLRKLKPAREAMCSGWMQLRGSRRRRSLDMGFPLSDHCDWKQLNDAVRGTGAKHIYLTHGYEANYARWLSEAYGLQSTPLQTLYNEDMEDAE